MYKYILQSIEHVNWLALGSMLLFFLVFLVSSIWILTKKKGFIEKMSNLPLE